MTKPTEPLRAEHRELVPHVTELRAVADAINNWEPNTPERIAQTVGFLRDHLVPHAQAEEAVLYPTVERLRGAPGATATMIADHAQIVARIEALATLSQTFTPQPPPETKPTTCGPSSTGWRPSSNSTSARKKRSCCRSWTRT